MIRQFPAGPEPAFDRTLPRGRSGTGRATGPCWRRHRMNSRSNTILFWASFLTLIAAGMGFSIRGDILNEWGREFGFTQTELGEITGMGLMAFGLTIIFFSFFADLVGYGWLMVIAFLLHAASVVVTLAAHPLFETQFGKPGAYWCLFIGQTC